MVVEYNSNLEDVAVADNSAAVAAYVAGCVVEVQTVAVAAVKGFVIAYFAVVAVANTVHVS